NGRVEYGRSLANQGSSAFGGIGVSAARPSPDFTPLHDFMRFCSKTTPNVVVTRRCVAAPKNDGTKPQVCTLTLKGTNSGVNIASIPLGQVAGTDVFKVEVPAGS